MDKTIYASGIVSPEGYLQTAFIDEDMDEAIDGFRQWMRLENCDHRDWGSFEQEGWSCKSITITIHD